MGMASVGSCGDAPDEFNLNYILPPAAHYFSTVDWVHFNGVDYDPVHDRDA